MSNVNLAVNLSEDTLPTHVLFPLLKGMMYKRYGKAWIKLFSITSNTKKSKPE